MSSTRRLLFLRLFAGLAVFLLGCPPPQPGPTRAVLVQGFTTVGEAGLALLGELFFLAPNSTGSFVLVLRDPNTRRPVADSPVTVDLVAPGGERVRIFSGRTDSRGLAEVSFTVPAEVAAPEQVLTVRASSTRGTITYEEPVYVGRAYNVLVSTDKPVYQPGQTIHIRGLALDTLALQAANRRSMVFTVEDPSGNKLLRRELSTSQYGIAALDFQLDSQAPSGDYIIRAQVGPVSSSRSVEVKPYTLPRFAVKFSSDRSFYLPGETATGTIQADYFFGKPVAGGQVQLRAFVTDVDRVQVAELTGTTDAEGSYRYELTVPDYFVGQLENNTAELDVEITVVDTANHAETIDETLTIAEKTLLIEAVPESGTLREGLENLIYVNVSYPDGRAAPATLTVAGPGLAEPLELATDDFGLAHFSHVPDLSAEPRFTLTAVTAAGEEAIQVLTLDGQRGPNTLLLRPDRAELRIGDTLNVDIYVAGEASTVYLDVVKGRQTFALAALPVVDGVAQAALDMDGSLLGTLELNAYAINDRGEIVRDRRLVLVNPAPAQVSIETDAQVYRPGEHATVTIQVSRDGAPMPGALGISIVDESVFSVGAQDPGFARTYFLLERELLEPRYQIRGFVDLGSDDPSPYDDNPDSIRIAGVPRPVPAAAAARARELALHGLFAHELAQQQAESATAPVPYAAHAPWWYAWAGRLALIAPLLGFVLYDGTRTARRRLLATLLLGLLLGVVAACAAPAAEPAPAAAPAAMTETTATRGSAASPRLRQYFPETLYWNPELVTDDQGRAQVELPLADSITSWRISVLASDTEGNLGSAQTNLRVFQEFFVEPDLPRFLTVDDEIDIPISVYNYLDTAQRLTLRVEQGDWFELRGPAEQTLEIAAQEVRAVYIPIRVTAFGQYDFTVTALGDAASDAVRRTVEVLPNGRPQSRVLNVALGATQSYTVGIPEAAVPGTGRVTVKLYPGIVAQTVDGLAAMLQQPHGCFEQTSSVNYPNILILDYLRRTGQLNPSLEMSAERYLNTGYQRLLTFEVRSMRGGFSLYGNPPPDTLLTAYGLMQFNDMSRVRYVDPALLERIARFLMDRQQQDGGWSPFDRSASASADEGSNPAASAYIVWALADAGHAESDAVRRGVDYLTKAVIPSEADSYLLALTANALIAAGSPAQPLLDELAGRALPDRNDSVRWTSNATTWLLGYGETVTLETTALVTIAFLRAGEYRDLATRGLRFLTDRRDRLGAYGSTQSTVMVLKALILAAQQGGEGGDATVTLRLSDGRTATLAIDESNDDVVQQVSFDDIAANGQTLEIVMTGERSVQAQIITSYVLPWSTGDDLPPSTPQGVRIRVAYDRTELVVNDQVQVSAEVELLRPGVATTLLADVGIPPGFSPVGSDLDDLVSRGLIARYELTGRQIIFYLENFPSGEPRTLTYRLLARYPLRAQTQAHRAYDYYTPSQQATQPPQRIIVTLGAPR